MLLLLAALISTTPATSTVDRSAERSAEATGEASAERPPWRGSLVTLRSSVGAIGLAPDAELTWNPYVALGLSLQPRWWLADSAYLRAGLELTRELTAADATTYADEAVLGDLGLGVGLVRLLTIPGIGVDLSGDLGVTLPTSKVSLGRTLVLGLASRLTLSRSFHLAGELYVGYSAKAGHFFHRLTTSERVTPLVPGCIAATGGCDAFLNTGARNAPWRVQHGVDLAWTTPLEWLSVTLSLWQAIYWLYPTGDDPRVSLQPQDPTDRREYSVFQLEVMAFPLTPLEALGIGIGCSTVSPQLAPDASYRNPFFNRYTTVFVDLRLSIEGVVAQIVELEPTDG